MSANDAVYNEESMQCKKKTRIFSHKLVKLTLEIPRYIFGSMDTMESIDIDCITFCILFAYFLKNIYYIFQKHSKTSLSS